MTHQPLLQCHQPLSLAAEGATSEDAIRNLQSLLEKKLASGTRLVGVEIPTVEHPWITYAGMFKDHPLFDEVVAIMAEQRKQAEADPDYR